MMTLETNLAYDAALLAFLGNPANVVVQERVEQPAICEANQTIVGATVEFVSNSTTLPGITVSDAVIAHELQKYARTMFEEARVMEPEVADLLNRTFWDSIG